MLPIVALKNWTLFWEALLSKEQTSTQPPGADTTAASCLVCCIDEERHACPSYIPLYHASTYIATYTDGYVACCDFVCLPIVDLMVGLAVLEALEVQAALAGLAGLAGLAMLSMLAVAALSSVTPEAHGMSWAPRSLVYTGAGLGWTVV